MRKPAGTESRFLPIVGLRDLFHTKTEYTPPRGTLKTRSGCFQTNQVILVVEAMDSDVIYDDHLVTMGKNVSYTTAMKKSDARWNNAYMCSGSYQ